MPERVRRVVRANQVNAGGKPGVIWPKKSFSGAASHFPAVRKEYCKSSRTISRDRMRAGAPARCFCYSLPEQTAAFAVSELARQSDCPFSRLARRSIFILACVLADPVMPDLCTGGFALCRSGRARFGCFRLEQQLPGGISSSHWKSAFFSWHARNLG